MKASLALAVLGACAQPAYGVVQFPFAKHGSPPQNTATGASETRALNTDFFLGAMTYVVNASVGTPNQPVSLVLSPSSSDTWVVDARSDYCTYYSSYYGSSSYDDYDTDSESTGLCKWGSCKYKADQTADPSDYDLGSFPPLGPPGAMSITESYSTFRAMFLISTC